MSEDRSQHILDLCDNWLSSAVSPHGVSTGNDRFRLRNNNLWPHTMTYRELRAACISATRTLLHAGQNAVVDPDHQYLWAWCVQLLIDPHAAYFLPNEYDLAALMRLACRAALADFESKPVNMPVNSGELAKNSSVLLTYLSLPLLDGVLKKTCSSYVQYDGTVRQQFERIGRPKGLYKQGSRCSSIEDLLWLLYNHVADKWLRDALDDVRKSISIAAMGKEAFSTIYGWRNHSLHGQATYTTIGGSILTITLLIALTALESNFQHISSDNLASVISWRKSGKTALDWPRLIFYPPN